MEVVSEFLSAQVGLDASVVGIGTFDGVHRGHQAVVSEVVRRARARGVPSWVLTFEPLPRDVLQPGTCTRLTSYQARLRLLEQLGPDNVGVLTFDEEFARTSGEDFVKDVLQERLGALEVVVGFNFSFGHQRSGTPERLVDLGREWGFGVHVVSPCRQGGAIVSSTRIRRLIEGGDLEQARQLLGHPHILEGQVVSGEGRGRKLGFPTANLEPSPQNLALPARGVYAARVVLDGESNAFRPAVVNVGIAPTFGGGPVRIEAHLIDFDGELKGRTLRLSLLRRLRNERQFPRRDDLVHQIRLDVQACREGVRRRGMDLEEDTP